MDTTQAMDLDIMCYLSAVSCGTLGSLDGEPEIFCAVFFQSADHCPLDYSRDSSSYDMAAFV